MQVSLRPTSSSRPVARIPLGYGVRIAHKPVLCAPALKIVGENAQAVCCSAASIDSSAFTAAPTPRIVSTPERQHSWLSSATAFLARSCALVGLVVAVALATAGNAFAARSSGRMGGGSFGARSGGSSFGAGYSGGSRSAGSSFGGGFGGGYGGGSSFSAAPRSSHTTIIHGGPSWGHTHSSGGGSMIVTLLMLGVMATIAIEAFRMWERSSHNGDYSRDEDEPPVTVAKVQVGLLAVAKDIKADLNMLAAAANTSTAEGLHLLLQETVVALLRNPAYCAYGSSSSRQVDSMKQAESLFNSMSMEERSKVDAETLVNVGGRRGAKTVAPRGQDGPAELIVVNLMVAMEGRLELPAIRSLVDLKLAISKLGSIAASDLVAVEVFWTPQEDHDVLTQQDCLVMYPSLVPL